MHLDHDHIGAHSHEEAHTHEHTHCLLYTSDAFDDQ